VGRVASNVRVDTRVSAFLCSVDDERLREGSAVRHAARAEGAERLAGYAAWRRDRETRNGGRIVAGRPVPPEHADLDSPDGYLLGGLGIAPSHEGVYRVLLRHGSADVSELAQLTTLSPGALRRVVAVLEVEGLVTRLTGRRLRFVATSPHVAIGAIAARREEELARARGSVEILAGETRHRSGSPPEELIEVVTGQSAVGRSFLQLNLTARRDVRAFVRPPFAADVSQPPVTQDTALRRGVQARSVYDVSAFETPGLLEAARDLVRAGEQARVATVPMKLVIVDSKIAMLPLTSDDQHAAHSAVVVHQSTLLEALISLFETVWRSASPLRWTGEDPPEADAPLSCFDAEILSLLSAGLKDETVARQLGLSLRTLQRRLREVFESFGARTRFQAGFAVARQGVLDESPADLTPPGDTLE
jgi:sugar-specific transcriptional regulator TrmB/DNA-binding CsgD family transcriptional regulator